MLKEKRISFCQGKGSLTHNNRDFIAKNVDANRIKDNIIFISQSIEEAYDQLFKESTERYNAKQKRNDRKIKGTYYESLFHHKPANTVATAADKRKSFYEDIVQIGKMEDSGIGTEDAELVTKCLKQYMKGYQERNPNFYVFNAVLHMDEATPHLHIDYIPIGHYKRGQDVQNGIAQALKEMGYGDGKFAIARWRESEIEVLNKICLEHNIQPLAPEKARGSMTVEEYKEYAHAHEKRISEEQTLSEVQKQLENEQLLLHETAELTVQIKKLDNVQTRKTLFGGKTTVNTDEYADILKLAKKQIATENQERKAIKENKMLKTKISEIRQKISQLESELEQYKKPAYISRDTMKQQAREISEKEQLKVKYQKAISFIDDYGLKDKYYNYQPNIRKIDLE